VSFCGDVDNLVEAAGKNSVSISSIPARDARSPDESITKSGGEEPGDHFDIPAPKHGVNNSSFGSCVVSFLSMYAYLPVLF
jgi:hypothetical protein